MSKVILDLTMSLDGYIAGSNGEGDDGGLHHWLFGGTIPVNAGGMTFYLTSENSAEVLREFVQNAGAFVLGKRTFHATGKSAPFQLPTFVLSHDAQAAITVEGTTITFVSEGIESALRQAKAAAGGKAVYIFGGANTAQQYLWAGLIDEIQIHLVPVLIGDGTRLFDSIGKAQIALENTRVIEGSGVTHLYYHVMR